MTGARGPLDFGAILRAVTVALAALALVAPCCTRAPAPASAPSAAPARYPADTALAVDAVPIASAEIDRVAAWVALIYPQYSLAQARRLALTNTVLPRAAVAIAVAAARDVAHQQALAAARQLGSSAAPTSPTSSPTSVPTQPVPRSASGSWATLGLEIYGPARSLSPTQWSPVEEGVGRFFLVRLDERDAETLPSAQVLTISLLEFPYLAPETTRKDVDRMIDSARLTIVDPAWNDIVPLEWQYRMRGPAQ